MLEASTRTDWKLFMSRLLRIVIQNVFLHWSPCILEPSIKNAYVSPLLIKRLLVMRNAVNLLYRVKKTRLKHCVNIVNSWIFTIWMRGMVSDQSLHDI